MLKAQRAYFVTALMNTVYTSLESFRYRSSDTFYDDGDVLGTHNYWKIANLVHGYSSVAFWSVATVT